MEDESRGATSYRAGVALETQNSLPAFVMDDDRKKKKLKSQKCPFVGCFGRNHGSTNSKQCVYHKCKTKKELFSAIEKYLETT